MIAADARGAIRGVVLRPAVVYGAGAPGNTARLLALVRRGTVPLVAGGRNEKSVVHVDDLCASAALAIEAGDRAAGRTFNIAGEPLGVRAMCDALASGLGRSVRWVPLPAAPLAAIAAVTRAASRASGGRVPDLGRALDVFMGEATVDATAIHTTLGARFRPSAEGFAAMARGEQGSTVVPE